MAVLFLEIPGFEARLALRSRPDLVAAPVVVCRSDPTGRARILSRSPKAARSGVPWGCTREQARAACPDVVFVDPEPKSAALASRRFVACLQRFGSRIETAGTHRAYLELSGEDALERARALVCEVGRQLGLLPRVGLAESKVLARAAARRAEDGAVVAVSAGDEARVLAPLPVRMLWGVDLETERALSDLGVCTAGDLKRVGEQALVERFGPEVARSLWEQAHGSDRRGVVPFVEPHRVEVEAFVTPPAASAGALAGVVAELAGALDRELGGLAVTRVGIRVETVRGEEIRIDAPGSAACQGAGLLSRLRLDAEVAALAVFAELGAP